jgi:hypothetical protein
MWHSNRVGVPDVAEGLVWVKESRTANQMKVRSPPHEQTKAFLPRSAKRRLSAFPALHQGHSVRGADRCHIHSHKNAAIGMVLAEGDASTPVFRRLMSAPSQSFPAWLDADLKNVGPVGGIEHLPITRLRILPDTQTELRFQIVRTRTHPTLLSRLPSALRRSSDPIATIAFDDLSGHAKPPRSYRLCTRRIVTRKNIHLIDDFSWR